MTEPIIIKQSSLQSTLGSLFFLHQSTWRNSNRQPQWWL